MSSADSHQHAAGWAPIAEGPLGARTIEAIHARAEALWERAAQVSRPGLANGAAGLAVTFSYLDDAFPGRGHRERAEQLLDRAIDGVAEAELGPSLSEGFTGVAWVIEHLDRRAGKTVDRAGEIDETLLELVSTWPEDETYDLLYGVVGIGVYALERRDRPLGAPLLARVVDRLEARARRDVRGCTWSHPPEKHDLGVAHGLPGVVGLLAGAVRLPPARALLEGAVAWLLAHRASEGEARFGYFAEDDLSRTRARSAWCYGNPGVAAALRLAADALEVPAWRDEAAALVRGAAVRPFEQTGVIDGGLCHGTAGLLAIFSRLSQSVSDPQVAQAARDWLERTLVLPPCDEPGLLEGDAGVILALLSAVTDLPPDWDHVLLLSLPT